MSKVRIAYYVNSKVRGGVEEHIITLINGIDRSRYRPIVAASRELLDLIRGDLDLEEGDIFPLDIRSRFDLRMIRDLSGILRERKVDLLHTHMFVSTLSGVPAARLAGVPVVVETSHGRETWRKGKWTDQYVIDRMIYRGVKGVIAVSRGCADFLRDVKRIPESKVTVIWNGRDLCRFDPLLFDRAQLRRRFGLEERGFVFGTLGRMEPQKRHDLLLTAVSRVKKCSGSPFLAVIVGDGSQRPCLERMIAELDIADRVLMPGFQKNPEEWLASFDGFVLSSDYEGFPLALVEAGAMGLPVVSTSVDGADEIIRDGGTGCLVPVGDVDRLADGMLRILTDQALAKRLGEGLRDFSLKNLSLSAQVAKTEVYYSNIMRPV